MKKLSLLAVLVCALTVAAPLRAQNGCTDSPENPTALLALAGSAGALVVAARARLGRRK